MVHVNKFHLSNYPTDFTKCGGKIPNKKILGARSLWELDFAWWCQAFADPQYGTCFMAPLWHLKLKRWLLYSYKICALLTLGEYIFGSYCLLCMKLKKNGHYTKTGHRHSTPSIHWHIQNMQFTRTS